MRSKYFNDIFQAYGFENTIWTRQQTIDIKRVMDRENFQPYNIMEKLKDIDLSSWEPEQRNTIRLMSVGFKKQEKLIEVLKKIIGGPLTCSLFIDFIRLQ